MTITSKDVARIAGVSQSTVSYVMSGKRPISEETRQRVLAAIEELTYQPNAGARALAGRRTNVVGLVVPFGTGADMAGLLPFIETIASSARAHDHDVLLVTSDEGSAGLRRLAGRALCDAIVLMDLQATDERVPVAASLRVPVVLVGVPDDPQGLHCVDIDFALAARLAVEELAQTGHDCVTLIGYSAAMVERRLNYMARFIDSAEETARRLGIDCVLLSPVEPGRAGAACAVQRLLRQAPPARQDPPARHGLVVPHTEVMRPLLHALAAAGLVPGQDISVIGLSTDSDAEESEPPLTNVSLEPRDVSRRAMETLFWLVGHEGGTSPPQVALVPPRLTRRSTVMPT